MPVPDVILVDVALHLRHLALIGQDDHHGGVALIGQHDDGGVVVLVLVEVVAAGPLHHVHLNSCGIVHVEICLVCLFGIEGLLPLPCMRRWKVEMDIALIVTFSYFYLLSDFVV